VPRPPLMETRWFSLSGRELHLLAITVGIALLAAGMTRVIARCQARHAVEVVGESPGLSAPPRLDINTAPDYELTALPGIGTKTAAAIVEYRDRHGAFEQLEDLAKVRGIGSKTVERIRPHAMCAPVQSQ